MPATDASVTWAEKKRLALRAMAEDPSITVEDAVELVGRSRTTAKVWMWKDPEFAAAVRALRPVRNERGHWVAAPDRPPGRATIPEMDRTTAPPAKAPKRLSGPDGSMTFPEFRKKYFGFDTLAHHARIIGAIEAAKPLSVTMILGPPQCAKTAILEDYFCWKLGADPNFRICVISEAQNHARKVIKHVQERMTDKAQYAAFIDDFGPFRLDPETKDRNGAYDRDFRRPWNADYCTVEKASNDDRDFSLEVKSAKSQIRGARYDLVVLDDIQSDKNFNDSVRLLETLRLEIFTRLSPQGHIVIIGNRVKAHDFYERALEAEGLIDALVKIPAIGEDGQSYWPERFPLEDMQTIQAKVGPIVWDTVYMQKAVSKVGATFTDDVLAKCLDRSRTLGQTDVGVDTLSGCDPALVNFAAFVTVAYNREKLWVLDIEAHNHLGSNEGMIRHIERISGVYGPTRWIIEYDGQGRSLVEDTRLRQSAENFNFRISKHETAGSKSEPVYGVTAMVSGFRNRQIVLPYGDERTRRAVDALLTELREWRPDVPQRLMRSDRLMALWFVWKYWQERRGSMFQDPSVFRRGVPQYLLFRPRVVA
ncbi:MAG: hypothetical protein LC750_07505 [Actinobacteria bacterium]|nr:hypothetical protein [Actinomycetota bacterium]